MRRRPTNHVRRLDISPRRRSTPPRCPQLFYSAVIPLLRRYRRVADPDLVEALRPALLTPSPEVLVSKGLKNKELDALAYARYSVNPWTGRTDCPPLRLKLNMKWSLEYKYNP